MSLFSKPAIMGILNVTPDSFSGDGVYSLSKDFVESSLKQTEKFLNEGATWIDVGGESTRAGALSVDEEEELKRVIPVVEAILKNFPDALLSIDTTKSQVAYECLLRGVHMINDVSGGKKDPKMFQTIKKFDVPFVLMHAAKHLFLKEEKDLYMTKEDLDFFYEELIIDIKKQMDYALEQGVKKENIILDPGIGFGKTLAQNISLISHVDRLLSLKHPILIGASRKSFIGKITGSENRLAGSLAVALYVAQKGAHYLRVHDVFETKQIMDMWWILHEEKNLTLS